jgi:beta-glucanase (GH16 family)
MLVIKPTLQDPTLMEKDGSTINLVNNGCTAPGQLWSSCVSVTNSTNGTVVNPVKSARLSTKINVNDTNSKGASIKYGRIEVVAQLPAGDWLWPAIWMLPVNNTYGPWPASGEIDIMESRGNNYTFPQGGNNVISSTLHWGPDSDNDQWWQNNVKRPSLHTTYPAAFHTFGVEWSEKYIYTYVDSRLAQVMYVAFNKPFWSKQNWPASNANGTRLVDPWSSTGRLSTPFDQDFYLIINLAVGGTNGWFQNGANGKPWVDSSPTARRDFWNARNQWYPTWEANNGGAMTIKSVKMLQQQGYNGCN